MICQRHTKISCFPYVKLILPQRLKLNEIPSHCPEPMDKLRGNACTFSIQRKYEYGWWIGNRDRHTLKLDMAKIIS